MPTHTLNRSTDAVRRLQHALAARGHFVGAPDGRLGPATKAALKAFQSAKGLTADGQLGRQTLVALGLADGFDAPRPKHR